MDMPVEANQEMDKPKPTARINLTKDEAKNLNVGSRVTMKIAGEVKSLHPSYDDKEMYEIELENPDVSEVKADKKKKAEGFADMPREKLKEKIVKSDDEESED